MEASEKCHDILKHWKNTTSFQLHRVKVKVPQLCRSLCDHTGWILQARILEWVAFLFFRGSSQPRDWTQVFCIAGRSFTSWATGKPKNAGVGSLFLLQWIFPTQEWNWGRLRCRQADSLPTELSGKPNCTTIL